MRRNSRFISISSWPLFSCRVPSVPLQLTCFPTPLRPLLRPPLSPRLSATKIRFRQASVGPGWLGPTLCSVTGWDASSIYNEGILSALQRRYNLWRSEVVAVAVAKIWMEFIDNSLDGWECFLPMCIYRELLSRLMDPLLNSLLSLSIDLLTYILIGLLALLLLF